MTIAALLALTCTVSAQWRYRDPNAPRSADGNVKVTERFRRPSFGQLLVDITIEDPKAYAKPWSISHASQLIADGELIEYICNENAKPVG